MAAKIQTTEIDKTISILEKSLEGLASKVDRIKEATSSLDEGTRKSWDSLKRSYESLVKALENLKEISGYSSSQERSHAFNFKGGGGKEPGMMQKKSNFVTGLDADEYGRAVKFAVSETTKLDELTKKVSENINEIFQTVSNIEPVVQKITSPSGIDVTDMLNSDVFKQIEQGMENGTVAIGKMEEEAVKVKDSFEDFKNIQSAVIDDLIKRFPEAEDRLNSLRGVLDKVNDSASKDSYDNYSKAVIKDIEEQAKAVQKAEEQKRKEAERTAQEVSKNQTTLTNDLARWEHNNQEIINSNEGIRNTFNEIKNSISGANTIDGIEKLKGDFKDLVQQGKEFRDILNFRQSSGGSIDDLAEKYSATIAKSSELSSRLQELKTNLANVNTEADKDNFSRQFNKFKEDVVSTTRSFNSFDKKLQTLTDSARTWAIKNRELLNSETEQGQKIKQIYEDFLKILSEAQEKSRNGTMVPDDINNVKDAWTEAQMSVKNFGKELKNVQKGAGLTADAMAASISQVASLIETKLIDSLYKLGTNALRGIINSVIELDAQLVEVRKVTNFTERELRAFVEDLRVVGNETGTLTTDLLEASAVFARSGFTKEQILQLTEEAAILKNVSDGITDMGKAAEILISVMKAYNVSASEARTITDQLNNISNNAAISFDDLAEGIQRVGSVFASAGTSIGELSALLTGANEVLQNIEKTSNGLKTISERIRQISSVTEDGMGTAKIEALLTSITSRYGEAVHIIDESNGQLRSTYDILEDLAEVWGRLSTAEQQKLGEAIAGKNQITVLKALLQNWQGVETAIKNAGEAARGSALVEQESQLNSLTGAINRFKAAVENLRSGAIDSGLVTSVVNMGTKLVNIFGSKGFLLTGVIALVTKISSLISPLGKIRTYAEGIGNFVNAIKKSSINVFDSVSLTEEKLDKMFTADQREYAKLLILDQKRLTTTQQRVRLASLQNTLTEEDKEKVAEAVALESARNSLIIARNALIAGAASFIVSIVLPKVLEALDESSTKIQHLLGEVEDITSKVEDYENKIKDINDAIDNSHGVVTQEQLDLLEEYKRELRQYQSDLAETQNKLAQQMSKNTFSQNGMDYISYYDKELKRQVILNDKYLKEFKDKSVDMTQETYKEIVKYLSDADPIIDFLFSTDDGLLNETQKGLKEMVKELEKSLDDFEQQQKTASAGLTKDSFLSEFYAKLKDLEKEQLSYNDIVEVSSEILNRFNREGAEGLQYLSEINDEFIEKFYAQDEAIEEVNRSLRDYADLYNMAVGDGVSASELLNIIEKWSEYADVISFENGELKISKDLVVAKAQASVDANIQQLESERTVLKGKIALLSAERAALTTSNVQAEATKENSNIIIRAINRIIQAYKNRNKVMAGGDAGTVDELTDSSTKRIAELDATIADLEKQLDFVNQQIDYLENLNVEELLKKVNKEAGKASKSTSKINKELQKTKDILKALQDQLKETSDVYKQVQEEMLKIIEAEKEGLEAANDALEENIGYYEARIRLIQEALEAEIAALEAQQEAAEKANEEAQQAIEDRIDAIEQETDAYEESNKAQQEAIDAQIEALEAQMDAIDAEAEAQDKALQIQEKLLEIEKARLAVEKAKDAYEQAKKSKTVRTYDAERGWIYTADQSAVNSAYDEYTSAQNNLNDLLQDYADMLAEAEREAQKAAIQEQIDALNAQKDILEEELEATKENAEQQKQDLQNQLDLLEEQRDIIRESFEQQIEELNHQSEEIGNISDNVERAVDKYLNDEGVQDWFAQYMNASEEEREEMLRALEGDWLANLENQNTNNEEIDRLDELIDQIKKMLEVTEYSITSSEGIQEWLQTFKDVSYEDRLAMVDEMRNSYQEYYTAQSEQIQKVQEAIDKIEGNINLTYQLLKNWGTGNYNTPVNSFASGGVVNSGLLSHTGMLSDYVKVHGSPSSPELILNGQQQANLLYRLAQRKPNSVTNNSNTEGSIFISNLSIQADSNDTLHNLLIQARQLAMIS